MNVLGVVIVALGIAGSIALHELGHMWPAKRFGVKVTQYMIGFGPTIWSRRKGETEYGFKFIPLGGYIRMIGMFPPAAKGASSTGRFRGLIERARAESFAEVAEEDAARTFWRLPVRKKLVIMAGGPTMNLLLSALLFTIAFSIVGQPTPSTAVSAVVACVPTTDNPDGLASVDGSCQGSSPTFASAAKLQPGDKITAIDGTRVATWDEMSAAIRKLAGRDASVTVVRESDLELTLSGRVGSRVVDGKTVGFLGTRPAIQYLTSSPTVIPGVMWQMSVDSAAALLTLPRSTWDLAVSTIRGEPRRADGPISVVGIADVGGQIASSGQSVRDVTGMFLSLLASINLFLFLFNLVPLLPLDGGHVAGALWEAVRRRAARWRGRPDPGPVDTARMLPIAYAVAVALLVMSAVVMLADFVNPLSLS